MQAKRISLRGAAHIYGFSVDSLCRRFSEGVLPAVKTGYKLIRVRMADLDPVFRPMPDEYRYRW